MHPTLFVAGFITGFLSAGGVAVIVAIILIKKQPPAEVTLIQPGDLRDARKEGV